MPITLCLPERQTSLPLLAENTAIVDNDELSIEDIGPVGVLHAVGMGSSGDSVLSRARNHAMMVPYTNYMNLQKVSNLSWEAFFMGGTVQAGYVDIKVHTKGQTEVDIKVHTKGQTEVDIKVHTEGHTKTDVKPVTRNNSITFDKAPPPTSVFIEFMDATFFGKDYRNLDVLERFDHGRDNSLSLDITKVAYVIDFSDFTVDFTDFFTSKELKGEGSGSVGDVIIKQHSSPTPADDSPWLTPIW